MKFLNHLVSVKVSIADSENLISNGCISSSEQRFVKAYEYTAMVSAIFSKESNFCDFLFVSLHYETFPLKEEEFVAA